MRKTGAFTPQQSVGQVEVFGSGHFEILQGTGDQQRRVAQGLDGAGFVRHGLARGRQCAPQQAQAEHLWRLRLPVAAAVGRAKAALAFGLFQGVGHRLGQQAPHGVVAADVDQGADPSRPHQAACRVVHQHPVVVGGASLLQGRQARGHAGGTGGAAASNQAAGKGRHFHLEPSIVGRHDHVHAGDGGHGCQRVQGVDHQRAVGHGHVLFGAGLSSTAAHTSGRNQGMAKREGHSSTMS
jgi:hypothetical protein